jgi:hypothetical protein
MFEMREETAFVFSTQQQQTQRVLIISPRLLEGTNFLNARERPAVAGIGEAFRNTARSIRLVEGSAYGPHSTERRRDRKDETESRQHVRHPSVRPARHEQYETASDPARPQVQRISNRCLNVMLICNTCTTLSFNQRDNSFNPRRISTAVSTSVPRSFIAAATAAAACAGL